MKFNTKSVHTGVYKDSQYNSVTTPIYPINTFRFTDIHTTKAGYDYTRSGNPTRRALEENIAALEGGADAHCTSTGMSAITGVLHLLKTGDHVITGNDIYGGTYRLMHDVFTKMGIEFSFVEMGNPEKVKTAVKESTRMIWIETPSNPLLNLVDIKKTCETAKEAGAISVVDNTFMTPYFQRPFELGTDLVIHSTTKYLNGHSDVVGGAIVSRTSELAEQIHYNVNALGISEAPFDSWLVLRGVKTLGVRMEQHAGNAAAVAEFLNSHPNVERTYFPGLIDHPHHALACEQMSGFGGMVSFDLKPGSITIDKFVNNLKYFALAESLGGIESLVEAPWYMSHTSINEKARRKAGIKETCLRLSLGIEDTEDLIDDLKQALQG